MNLGHYYFKYVLPAVAAAGGSGAAGGAVGAAGGSAGGAATGGAAAPSATGQATKAAGETAAGAGPSKMGPVPDPSNVIRKIGGEAAGFVNAFSSVPESAGSRYRADLERIKAQRYASTSQKHPSWTALSTGENTHPALAAYYHLTQGKYFHGDYTRTLADAAAEVHKGAPHLSVPEAIHEAAKKMTEGGVSDVWVNHYARTAPDMA